MYVPSGEVRFTAGPPAGPGERRRPRVLEDQQERRGVRLQIVADVGDVVRVEQPVAGLAVDRHERRPQLRAEGADLERSDLPVSVR